MCRKIHKKQYAHEKQEGRTGSKKLKSIVVDSAFNRIYVIQIHFYYPFGEVSDYYNSNQLESDFLANSPLKARNSI